MKDSPVLIVGGDSVLGAAMGRLLTREGRPYAATTRHGPRVCGPRPLLDLTELPDDWTPPEGTRLAFICAAIPGMADCEDDPIRTRQVNVIGTVKLAKALVVAGSRVVFLSTTQVFDGAEPRARVDGKINPQSAYGRQKAAAEVAMLELGDAVRVVRMTKVYGPRPALLTDWAAALEEGQTIEPFDDVVIAPLSAPLVCETLLRIGDQAEAGIFHLSASEDITYAEVAWHLARSFGVAEELVRPCRAAARGLPAMMRPVHTSLDTSRAQDAVGWVDPTPYTAIDAIIDDQMN